MPLSMRFNIEQADNMCYVQEVVAVLLCLPIVYSTLCSASSNNDGLFQIDKTMICWDINGTYSGYISRTRSNRRCQPWTSMTPHAHNFTQNYLFPADGSVANASDYCRDPYGISKPWCFTKDIKKRWEFCRVPICNSTCTSDSYVCQTINGIKQCFIDNSTCGDTRRSYEAYNLVIGLIVGTIVIICAVATIWFIFLCFSASKDDTDEDDVSEEDQISQIKVPDSGQPSGSSQSDSPPAYSDITGQTETGEPAQKRELTKEELKARKEMKEQKLISKYLKEFF